MRLQHVVDEHRLEDVELEVPARAGDADRDVVAHDLRADHRQRLALRRVHLAGHDRAARLVRREHELADARSAGRSRGSACRWRSSCSATASTRVAPLARDERVVAGERRELVGRGAKRQAGELGDLRRRRASPTRGARSGPVPTAVPPSASSSSRPATAASFCSAKRELRDPAADLLSERERRRVLQVRAADLHDVGERRAPCSSMRAAQGGDRGQEALRRSRVAAATCITVGNTSFDDCDTVHVVVRVDRACFARRAAAAEISLATVRDHLVRVHVRLRARCRSARRRAGSASSSSPGLDLAARPRAISDRELRRRACRGRG